MTYHFYLFVGKFPKLFNFSEGKEKIYLVELTVFKENAFYGLQKILLDNFSWNFYIWRAIVNGTSMQKIKIGHRAKFRAKSKFSCRFYFQFAQFYAAFNFRWAYFNSFSWHVHLGVDCTHACSEKPFRASLNGCKDLFKRKKFGGVMGTLNNRKDIIRTFITACLIGEAV